MGVNEEARAMSVYQCNDVNVAGDHYGGRLTKWKGMVASYAPGLGHASIVFAASVAIALPSHQAMGQFVADGTTVNASGWSVFTTGDNEPGLWARNGGTIQANNTTPVSTQGFGSYGVFAETDGTINLTNSTILTSGDNAFGAYARTDGTITILNSTITTDGFAARGINVETDGYVSLIDSAVETTGGNAIGVMVQGGHVDLSDTTVTTGGDNAQGLRAIGGASSITANDVDVLTQGMASYGVYAQNGAQIDLSGGSVTTEASGAYGIWANNAGSSITILNTDIATLGTGNSGHGVFAQGGGSIELEGGSVSTAGTLSFGLNANGAGSTIDAAAVTIETAGTNAHGVQASAGGVITLDDVVIDTSGGSANGIWANGNNAQVSGSATISTEGSSAHGAYATSGGNVDVAGSIVTTGNSARGLYATSGTSVLTSSADVTTSGSSGAHGAQAHQGATIAITGGAFETNGTASNGLHASLLGSTLTAENVTVLTNGSTSYGVLAESTGQIDLTNAVVATTGLNAYGLRATGANSYISGTNVDVMTTGNGAYGAIAHNGASMDLDGGSITTSGTGGAGLWANSGTIGATDIDISTTGSGGHGVQASVNSTLDFIGGSVSTAGDGARGLTVSSNSTLTASDTSVQTTGANSHAAYLTSGGTLIVNDSTLFAQGAGAGGLGVGQLGANALTNATLSNVSIVSVDGISIFAEENTLGEISMDNVEALTNNGRLLDVADNASLALSASNSRFEGDAFTAATGFSDVSLTDGTVWTLTGDSNLTTLLNDASTIAFAAPMAGQFKTLTVNGDYTGADGTLVLNTYLGADGSPSDLLHVEGDTSGSSNLRVNNAGGPGAQTLSDGIMVVQVDGVSAGQFSLLGDYEIEGQQAVIAGAYGYTLWHHGVIDPQDGNWYLRSQLVQNPVDPVDPESPVNPIYQPGVPIYEAYPQVLLGMNGLPTLQQRVGNRYWNEAQGEPAETIFCKDASQNFRCAVTRDQDRFYADSLSQARIDENGVWGLVEASHARFRPEVTTSETDYDLTTWRLRAGVDTLLSEGERGKLIGGLNVHYGYGSANIDSFFGTGSIGTHAYGIGATATWYDTSGFYLDAQGQLTWFNSDLSSDWVGGLASGNNGFGYALSLEGGHRIGIDDHWTLIPQAQLTYSNVRFDAFTDPFGANVSLDSAESLRGRIGLAVEHQSSWTNEQGQIQRASLYGIGNLHYDFLDGTRVDVSGTGFSSRNDPLWGEIGLGGTYSWDNDKYSLYGELSASTSLTNFGDSYSLGGKAGLRVQW